MQKKIQKYSPLMAVDADNIRNAKLHFCCLLFSKCTSKPHNCPELQ